MRFIRNPSKDDQFGKGDFCRGATVADFNNRLGKAPNAKVLMGINRQGFVDLLVEAIATYGKGENV